MKSCRAKVVCTWVQKSPEGFDYDPVAHLTAVIYDENGNENEENKSFSNSTPSLNLTISVSKDVPASKFFKENREYYLDFTRIPLETDN